MSQDLDEAGRGLRIEVEQGLIVFALWGLAVAQPLLDLFGKTPEFFVAAELSRGQIVGFALCFVFVGPIVLIVLQTMVHRVSPRAGLIVHRVIVSVLGFAFAMGLLVSLGLDGIVLTLVLAVPLTLLIYSLDSRWEAGRTLLCWLALLLIRVAERRCDSTWRQIATELGRIHAVTLDGPAGTVVQTTPPSDRATGFLRACQVDPPPRITHLQPA